MKIHQDVEKVLVPQEEIIARCEELGQIIAKDYEGKKPVFVGLLKGSVVFLAELIQHVDLDLTIDFMDVSSYAGTESSGDVKIIKDMDTNPKDKDIIIVEDIVDTGKTLATVRDILLSKGAGSVKIVTLLNKNERREVAIEADYVGFNVPNEFVIGFGLDYNQKYRNLPYVGVIKRSAI